jgi:hypothetical protein
MRVFECNSRSVLGNVGVPTKYKEESVDIYTEKQEIYYLKIATSHFLLRTSLWSHNNILLLPLALPLS